jgi:hypothetical protein
MIRFVWLGALDLTCFCNRFSCPSGKSFARKIKNTRVTLLEYLKQLHPVEWENFVKDTKILAEESAMFNGPSPFGGDEKGQSKMDDLPFYCIGFKSAAPEFTLRTRIWASLARPDSLSHGLWHDELLKGNQASLPRGKPRSRSALRRKHGQAGAGIGAHGTPQVQIRRFDAALFEVQQGGARERRVPSPGIS